MDENMAENNEIQRIRGRKPLERIMMKTHFSRFVNTKDNPVALDANGNDVERLRQEEEAEARSKKRKLAAIAGRFMRAGEGPQQPEGDGRNNSEHDGGNTVGVHVMQQTGIKGDGRTISEERVRSEQVVGVMQDTGIKGKNPPVILRSLNEKHRIMLECMQKKANVSVKDSGVCHKAVLTKNMIQQAGTKRKQVEVVSVEGKGKKKVVEANEHVMNEQLQVNTGADSAKGTTVHTKAVEANIMHVNEPPKVNPGKNSASGRTSQKKAGEFDDKVINEPLQLNQDSARGSTMQNTVQQSIRVTRSSTKRAEIQKRYEKGIKEMKTTSLKKKKPAREMHVNSDSDFEMETNAHISHEKGLTKKRVKEGQKPTNAKREAKKKAKQNVGGIRTRTSPKNAQPTGEPSSQDITNAISTMALPTEVIEVIAELTFRDRSQLHYRTFFNVLLQKHGLFMKNLLFHPDYPFLNIFYFHDLYRFPKEALCFFWYLFEAHTTAITFNAPKLVQYLFQCQFGHVPKEEMGVLTLLQWFLPAHLWIHHLSVPKKKKYALIMFHRPCSAAINQPHSIVYHSPSAYIHEWSNSNCASRSFEKAYPDRFITNRLNLANANNVERESIPENVLLNQNLWSTEHPVSSLWKTTMDQWSQTHLSPPIDTSDETGSDSDGEAYMVDYYTDESYPDPYEDDPSHPDSRWK